MARSRNRSGGGGRKAAGGGRQAKSRKSAAAPVAEVEVVEEEGGMGIDDGIPIMTAVLLLVAFILVDYVLGTQYSAGMFFK